MKRMCSIFLSIVMVLGVLSPLSVTASAASSGTLTSDISWELSDLGILTISGCGDMPEYSEESPSPFSGLAGIKKVSVSDGITGIGAYTFYNCADVKTITISETVESIGMAAFSVCPSLKTISVDKNNAHFYTEDGVLFNKEKTTLLQFPAGKTLTTYTIPQGVTHIGDVAFAFCNNLESVVFSDTVETMGFASFLSCSNLTTVEFNEGFTKIGENSFSFCNSLTTVTIPDDVILIGVGAFIGCESLSSVNFGNGLKEIANNAFMNCINLTSVAIPDSVESIGADAFADCEKLADITISDNVKKIGGNAFGDTAYLNDSNNWEDDVLYINNHIIEAKSTLSSAYTIKEGTKTIADDAFYNCSGLKYVTMPDGLINVGSSAFLGCGKLLTVVLPASVNLIGEKAFYSSEDLRYIFYGGTEEDWNDITIESDNAPLESAIIHYESDDHTYTTEMVEPTCTEDGYIQTSCEVCGVLVEYEPLSAFGHDFSDGWVVDTEPTPTSNGEKSHHCLICGERTDITQILYNSTIHDIAFVETEGFNSGGEITYVVSLKSGVGVSGSIFGAVFDPGVLEPVEDKSGAVGVVDSDGNQIDNFGGLFMDGIKNGTEDTYIVAHTNTKEISRNRDLGYVEFTFKLKDSTQTDVAVAFYCFEFTGTPQIENNDGVFLDYSVDEVPSATDVLTFAPNNDGTGYIVADCVSDYSGDLVIPETVNGLPVTAIGAGAFRDCKGITSIVIPDSVTSIGGFAFNGCSALKDVKLPDSITNIGNNAFSDCEYLVIYCNKNSESKKYVDDNDVLNVNYTDETDIDLITKIIYTDVTGGNLDDIISVSDGLTLSTDSVYSGTGAVVNITKNGTLYSQYTLVVYGDTNGDSVCDVLDCFEIERASSGNETLSGAYAEAGDINGDGVIDINDYQSIVNKAVA